MNDQPDQQAETQSAVEWAIKQWADWVAGKGGSIMQDTIMPLARRADEAEKPEWRQACMKIGVLLAPITQAAGVAEAVEELYIQRADLLHQVGDLRAQLAAAQARADLEADNARQSREEIEALKGDIKAMAENNNEWLRRAMEFEDKFNAAQAEARELREALEEISALYDNPSPVRAFNMRTVARAALAKKEGER